jgi:dolichyl-phosphate beta-glucosyltransferase
MTESRLGEANLTGAVPDGVSVILPALNLEDVIGGTVAALREELRPIVPALEFIVVDDGSTDGTAAAVERLRQTAADVRLLRNQRNLGKGVTVYLGLLAARYSKVCFTDGDLPFAPGSYARVVQRLQQGCPFAVASRRLADSELHVRMEVLRYAVSRYVAGVIFNYLVRKGLGLSFRDTQCGLKAFDRQVGIELFRRVHSPRFLFDIELFVAARQAGVPVDEVPVGVAYSHFKSSVRLSRDAARTFLGLAGIWLRHRRGRYRFANPAMNPEVVCGWAQEVPTVGPAISALGAP